MAPTIAPMSTAWEPRSCDADETSNDCDGCDSDSEDEVVSVGACDPDEEDPDCPSGAGDGEPGAPLEERDEAVMVGVVGDASEEWVEG